MSNDGANYKKRKFLDQKGPPGQQCIRHTTVGVGGKSVVICPGQDFTKGHALAEKAGARTDFSYVPGHLGEF